MCLYIIDDSTCVVFFYTYLSRTKIKEVWILKRLKRCYNCCWANNGKCILNSHNFCNNQSTKWSTKTNGVIFSSSHEPSHQIYQIMMLMEHVSIRITLTKHAKSYWFQSHHSNRFLLSILGPVLLDEFVEWLRQKRNEISWR